MDVEALHELEAGLKMFHCQIAQAHPFYIATEMSEVDTKDYEIRIFEGEELEPFRGDERFGEAFLFHELPKDEIGVGAYRDGVLLGMAGATSDSDSMWQIGINVMPGRRTWNRFHACCGLEKRDLKAREASVLWHLNVTYSIAESSTWGGICADVGGTVL